ncbi:MAG: beta-ketoacyl-ACP synthase III [Syntrophobacteraceae bacterium]
MSKRTAYIRSVGRFLPERRLTNSELEEMVNTSDEWIMTRTGIRERRILEPGLGNSHMAVRAARECLDRAGVDAGEVDAIILATVTPDMLFPATACAIQKELGARKAWAFDLSAGCCGFLFGLATASQMIESGRNSKVLVIGSDVMSTIVDYTDRNTCILFGDAAAAVLLDTCPDPEHGMLDFILRSDGSGEHLLYMKAGGSLYPASAESVANREHYVIQEGKSVFKVAVTEMAAVAAEIVEKNNLTGEDIALLVPHQANLRIIDAAAKRIGIDLDRVIINIDKYGNTTAATLPLCLYEAVLERNGAVKRGDYIVMAAFGAGFSWGSALLRWW